MEFKEFAKQLKNMCDTFNEDCCGCDFANVDDDCLVWCMEHPKLSEEMLKRWHKKQHSLQTNGDKFHAVMYEIFGKDWFCHIQTDIIDGYWWSAEYKKPKDEIKQKSKEVEIPDCRNCPDDIALKCYPELGYCNDKAERDEKALKKLTKHELFQLIDNPSKLGKVIEESRKKEYKFLFGKGD